MKKMSTVELLRHSHLLTTNNAGCITSEHQIETIKSTTTEYLEIKHNVTRLIKYSHIEFIRRGIWKTIIHVGSDLYITNVIHNTDLDVTKCFIELTNQVQRQTIVPKYTKQTAYIKRYC